MIFNKILDTVALFDTVSYISYDTKLYDNYLCKLHMVLNKCFLLATIHVSPPLKHFPMQN